eukprot:445748-Rhodomonas_salina.1
MPKSNTNSRTESRDTLYWESGVLRLSFSWTDLGGPEGAGVCCHVTRKLEGGRRSERVSCSMRHVRTGDSTAHA